MERIRVRWLGAVTAAFLLVFAVAHADEVDPQSEYARLLKGYQTVQPQGETPFGEQVSLYTGDLTFRQADIVLEGTGPTISLVRNLASAHGDTELLLPYAFGNWTLSIPRIETLTGAGPVNTQPTNPGLLWFVGTLPDGSKDYARCSNFGRPIYTGTLTGKDKYWYGVDLITESGGRQQILKRDALNTLKPNMTNASGNPIAFPAVTQQNWQVGCLNNTSNGEEGEGFFVVSPDGTKYWFDYLVGERAHTIVQQSPPPGPIFTERLGRMLGTMYVSRVEDRFGNSVVYNYGGDDKLDSIVASDGREVHIEWRTDGNRLIDHIIVQPGNAHERKWYYNYSNPSSVSARLTTVTLPDQTQWTFSLSGLGGTTSNGPDDCHIRTASNGSTPYISTITHPSGLVGKFYVTATWHARSYVPSACVPASPETGPEHESFPPLFMTYSLTKKEIYGPGVPIKAWTYSYQTAAGSTTSDPCATAGNCTPTKWVNVFDPLLNRTSYVFSNRWGETEGKLLRIDTYQNGKPTPLRSETRSYSLSTAGPWPIKLGSSMTSDWMDHTKDETWTPLKSKVIEQQGKLFNWQAKKFDGYGRVVGSTRSSNVGAGYSKSDYTDYENNTSLWVLGQVKKVRESANGTTPGAVVMQETAYDSATALPLNTKAFGLLKQSFTYDANGRLAQVKDPLNHAYQFSIYKLGIAQKIDFPDTTYISATVDDFGQIRSVRDQLNNTTGYDFDDETGRLKTITPPSGWAGSSIVFGKVAAEYGIPANHWRRTVSKGNARSITYYDAQWRPILTRDYDATNVAATLRVVATDYDGNGRPSFVSYPMATTPTRTASGWPTTLKGTRSTYDALGRPLQISQDTELPGAAAKSITKYDYNPGFETLVTDPRQGLTISAYQAFDTPSTDTPVLVQLPEGVTTSFVRDRYGKTLSMTRTGPYAGGTSSLTRSYVYDAYQRLCRVAEPETGHSVIAYDAADRVTWSATGLNISGTTCGESQVPTAVRIARTYDVMNRVTRMDYPPGTDDISYTYDDAGNVATAVSEGISSSQDIVWQYGARNSVGLPTSETLSVDGSNYSIQYGYNTQGTLKTITYPDDRVVDYLPDALGRATKAGPYATNVSYFPDGDLKYYRYGNGIKFLAEKNSRSLPDNLTYASAGGSLLYSQDLTYDESANLKSATDLLPMTPSRTKSMQYDLLNRLTQASAPSLWGTEIYTYDALDNIRSITRGGVKNSFEYDPLNRLTRISNPSSQTLHSYGYDTKGNVTSRDSDALTFDEANRLKAYAGKGNYRYDAWGRRVKRSNAAGVAQSYYLYSQAGQLLFEHELTANKLTDYVSLAGKLVAKIATDAPIPALQAPALSPNGNFSVSWAPISGASYVLEESAGGGSWTQVYAGSATSWNASGKADGSYAYRARACFPSHGCGSNSAAVTVVVDLSPQSAPTLTAPTYNPGPNYVVSWTAVTASTSYQLQEKGSGGIWSNQYNGPNLSYAINGQLTGQYSY